MPRAAGGRWASGGPADDPTHAEVPVADVLWREFQELGLSPYEARLILALLQIGSANTLQLARLAGVPRTSAYQVLEGLSAKGLAFRLPGDRAAVWSSPGRDEVLDSLTAALDASQQKRLRQHQARTDRVREMLSESLPEKTLAPLPYVRLVPGAAQVRKVYEQLLQDAQVELLMFTRPPYASPPGVVNPAVLHTLSRGVEVRVLYMADDVAEPGSDDYRAEFDVYHEAGVQARVVPELPIKLVVVDRRIVLMGMADPVLGDAGYPTFLHIEHPGCAAVQADAFGTRWAAGRPFVPAPPDATGGGEG